MGDWADASGHCANRRSESERNGMGPFEFCPSSGLTAAVHVATSPPLRAHLIYTALSLSASPLRRPDPHSRPSHRHHVAGQRRRRPRARSPSYPPAHPGRRLAEPRRSSPSSSCTSIGSASASVSKSISIRIRTRWHSLDAHLNQHSRRARTSPGPCCTRCEWEAQPCDRDRRH